MPSRYLGTGKRGSFLEQSANKKFISDFEILHYDARTEAAESKRPEEIIEQIAAIKDLRYRAILSLTAVLGKRITEICVLKKGDIRYDALGNVVYFHLMTEKWREKRDKIIPVSNANQQEVLPLLQTFAEYYGKLPLDQMSDDAYIFGDPGFFKVTRTYEKFDKTLGKMTEVKKIYVDNLLRRRVYNAAMRDAGLNPHLLRHWRASFIGHAKKTQYEGKDRLILIKSLMDFKRLESAQRYLRNMTQNEMKEVF